MVSAVTSWMQEGVTPATQRAIARAKKILVTSETLLQEAGAILQRALEQDETLLLAANAIKTVQRPCTTAQTTHMSLQYLCAEHDLGHVQ